MSNQLIERAKEALEGATEGPWTGHNMVHADRGDQMTPEEIGEYVCNAVKMGDLSRFLFVSGKGSDGRDVDVCHTGNGPCGPHNTALITLAPDLARALIREREAADRLAEALEHCLNEMRELIAGYSGAAVTDAQVEDDIKDEVDALAAYRAAQKETDDGK